MSEIESGLKEYIEHFGKEIVKNLDELNFYYKHEYLKIQATFPYFI